MPVRFALLTDSHYHPQASEDYGEIGRAHV